MTENAQPDAPAPDRAAPPPRTVVVVGPDGRPVGTLEAPADGGHEEEDPSRLIEQPAKVMRIGSMIKQLLEEVRAAPLDEKALPGIGMPHSPGHDGERGGESGRTGQYL